MKKVIIDLEELKGLLKTVLLKQREDTQEELEKIDNIRLTWDDYLEYDGQYYSFLDEEDLKRDEVNDALPIVLEEDIFPKINDEEYNIILKDIAKEMYEDADNSLTVQFMQEVRDRAFNHPIIRQKRIEEKRAAKK